jgi:hypothetical protein
MMVDSFVLCFTTRMCQLTVEELYPLGTRIKRMDPATNTLLAGTVIDIPLSTAPSGSTLYQLLFDNGTSASIQLAEMASLIPPPPLPASSPTDPSSDGSSSLLPPSLSINSRITYKHKGTYHKGFLTQKLHGMYRFSFKTHVKKKSKDRGVDLPKLPFNWVDLYTEGVLVPGHVAHSFLRSSSTSIPLVSTSSSPSA